MHAIQLAIQATAGAGDEVIYLSPAWPNFAAAAGIAGATPVPVIQDFTSNGWTLDPQKIRDAITPRTKALFINTPSNPSGWTADIETLMEILAIARHHGLWIIADEIYAHFYYGARRAPSFLDVMDPDDHIIFVNSFSKNWAMTGWRVRLADDTSLAWQDNGKSYPVFDVRRRAVHAAWCRCRARTG